MPASRKKQHPRSIDALFPVEVKRCDRGHSQTPGWEPGWGCSTCQKQDRATAEAERLRSGEGETERLRWRELLGPPPLIMELRTYDGQVQRFHPAPGRRKRRA